MLLGFRHRTSGFSGRCAACVLIAWLVTPLSGTPAPGASAPDRRASSRVVAVGDVHGAYDAFVAILQRAGLIDTQQKWIGGKAVLVQTGDVTDRGPGVRAALDLLMALEQQAAAARGRVHVLLGNHEIMNMLGETRDVTPEIFASFGGEAAYREAFKPGGRYGKWLRTKSPIARVENSLFMHAGINPDVTIESIDSLNAEVRRLVAQWDEGVRSLEDQKLIQPLAPIADIVAVASANKLPMADIVNSHLFHPDGVMWFRGYATWPDADGAPRTAALLKRYNVKRVVTGHTVQPKGTITQRFDGRLVLIDTGMLAGKFFPGGRASALEITGGGVNPIYVE